MRRLQMAARKNKIRLTDAWREKIRIGVIIDRMMSHVEGGNDMSATQLKAAEILLRKVAPDLARTEVTGEDGSDLKVSVTWLK